MLREIKKKMVILNNRMPFDPDVKSYFAKIEKNAWIYNNLRLEGSALTKEQVVSMTDGNLFMNAPIGEHLMAQNLDSLLQKLYSFASMKQNLDLRFADKIHGVIAGGEHQADYRKRSVIIPEWDYTPALPTDIPDRMNELRMLFKEAASADKLSESCFEYGAKIHNELLEISPYGEGDRLLARALTAYHMILKGYPAIVFDIKEQEYNGMIAKCLKTKDYEPFEEFLKREILDRLNLMIQLTAY